VGADLTPSVRYFNFDYNDDILVDSLDSIVAGRYEVLVADDSYGDGYRLKYDDMYAYDNTMRFYVYLDLHNPWASSGAIGQVNLIVGSHMADSGLLYWHSKDSAEADWGWYEPYSKSVPNSILKTYNGTRALLNNTASDYATMFCDYYGDALAGLHPTANWSLYGIWGDNMGIPQTLSIKTCPGGRGTMYEGGLGIDALYGCESQSDWHNDYRDTVLVKYLGMLGDSLVTRSSLDLCINGQGWGGYTLGSSPYAYQPNYYDTTKIGDISREREFGGRSMNAGEFFYPGPTNAAAQIDSATVASQYGPFTMFAHNVQIAVFGTEQWFNPTRTSAQRVYGWTKAWYDDLCLYYIYRSQSTYLSFSEGPNAGVLNWITGATDNACVQAGEDDDSCYWIDALGVRLGRDDDASAWNIDTVRYYLGSVQCLQCMDTAGIGKDDVSQNFVVFLKRWAGDDSYDYMVLSRTAGNNQSTFTSSWSPTFDLPTGDWNKLTIAGNWGSVITQDSLRNGEGGIYRQASAEEAASKSNRSWLLRMRRSVF